MHRIDYEQKHPRLDGRYRILSVPEKVLENLIIVIDKNAILWKKQVFENKIINGKETIDIDIQQRPAGKIAVTIRSVNKLEHIDLDLIKVLEVT